MVHGWLGCVCHSVELTQEKMRRSGVVSIKMNIFEAKSKSSVGVTHHNSIDHTQSLCCRKRWHTHPHTQKRFNIQQQLAVRRKNNKKRWYNTGALYNIGWPMTLLEGTLETTRVHVCACRRRRQKGNKHSKWTRWSQSIKEKMGRRGRNGGLVIAHLKNKLMVYTIAELGPT